jgi:hypothetical protein
VLVQPQRVEFVFKHHVINRSGSHLPAGSLDGQEVEQRAQTLWWDDRFEAKERLMRTAQELDGFLQRMVSDSATSASSSGGAAALRDWLRGVLRRT